jgi:hypothetical protein
MKPQIKKPQQLSSNARSQKLSAGGKVSCCVTAPASGSWMPSLLEF